MFDNLVHIWGSYAAQAIAQTTPQPSPESAAPPVPPSREERLALIPSAKSVVTYLDQYVVGQEIAKRRLALGVSNHFKRVVDAWVADDPLVTDPDLHNVRIDAQLLRRLQVTKFKFRTFLGDRSRIR